MRSTDRFLLAALIAATSASAQAGLTVIADHGGTPARPYYGPIATANVDDKDAYDARAEARSRGPMVEADMLPVTSDRLTPGSVARRAIDMPAGMTPFFIVGADTLSMRWLEQRGARLRELHAVGLVVNVKTADQLQRLRQRGEGLVMRPVAGDDIAKRLSLTHYPVLVTPEAIQQ